MNTVTEVGRRQPDWSPGQGSTSQSMISFSSTKHHAVLLGRWLNIDWFDPST